MIIGRREFDTEHNTYIMGILNVTPSIEDSVIHTISSTFFSSCGNSSFLSFFIYNISNNTIAATTIILITAIIILLFFIPLSSPY